MERPLGKLQKPAGDTTSHDMGRFAQKKLYGSQKEIKNLQVYKGEKRAASRIALVCFIVQRKGSSV
jgi:hypothetical protein